MVSQLRTDPGSAIHTDHSSIHVADAPYAGPQAAAVIDIGGDIGALLVYTDASLAECEIELFDQAGRPVMHTEVHPRSIGPATMYAGLFPSVPQGDYSLVCVPGAPGRAVVIRGANVTELDVRLSA
jgi:hypothetical protein